uniref:Secreted protein n=1 Tax=Mesocestoides corti TaxID=53468 RepID=A0A5K3FXK8_MESCO
MVTGSGGTWITWARVLMRGTQASHLCHASVQTKVVAPEARGSTFCYCFSVTHDTTTSTSSSSP